MKKIAVILSGCGVCDGSEIHEAVLTLLHLSKNNVTYQCASIDSDQTRVFNHKANVETAEKRNMLVEAARIARGNIVEISQINPKDYDALIFPGGQGAALNLCSFAREHEKMNVRSDVENLILKFHEAKKPIGAICIAPIAVAKALSKFKVNVTIGNDAGAATCIKQWGAEHTNCKADEICYDPKNLVVTTPAYMLGKNIAEIEPGIEKLVKKICSI